MTRDQLENILEPLLPKLFGFSCALTRSEEEAGQILIDAYTVFILKEKNFVADMSFDPASKRDRVNTKRYFFNELLKEIYTLARKRTPRYKFDNSTFREFENFYDLNVQKRAMLFLKDVANLTVEDLQEVFALQRHQVIELLHNAYHGLVYDVGYNQPSEELSQ